MCGRLWMSLTSMRVRGPKSLARYASELSMAMTWPICSPIVRRQLSSLKIWHRSTICSQIGKSSWSLCLLSLCVEVGSPTGEGDRGRFAGEFRLGERVDPAFW